MKTRCEVDGLFVPDLASRHADLGIRARVRECATSQETILRFIHNFAFIGGAILPTSHIFLGRSGIDLIS